MQVIIQDHFQFCPDSSHKNQSCLAPNSLRLNLVARLESKPLVVYPVFFPTSAESLHNQAETHVCLACNTKVLQT